MGGCLYLALLDRTARSCVFMLAGCTAALIGFPAVEAPLNLFDNAVARVEEIGLDILCATLLDSLVLPVGMGQTLLAVLDRRLGEARRWFADVLRRPTDTPAALGGGREAQAAPATAAAAR